VVGKKTRKRPEDGRQACSSKKSVTNLFYVNQGKKGGGNSPAIGTSPEKKRRQTKKTIWAPRQRWSPKKKPRTFRRGQRNRGLYGKNALVRKYPDATKRGARVCSGCVSRHGIVWGREHAKAAPTTQKREAEGHQAGSPTNLTDAKNKSGGRELQFSQP